jgi:hypothetical protein
MRASVVERRCQERHGSHPQPGSSGTKSGNGREASISVPGFASFNPGYEDIKERKRNAGSRSISWPAHIRRAGRATERRLAPPFRFGRARLPAFHHGTCGSDRTPPLSSSSRASRDGAIEERVLSAPCRPGAARSYPRGPVIVPAGRFGPEPPGSGVTARPREPHPPADRSHAADVLSRSGMGCLKRFGERLVNCRTGCNWRLTGTRIEWAFPGRRARVQAAFLAGIGGRSIEQISMILARHKHLRGWHWMRLPRVALQRPSSHRKAQPDHNLSIRLSGNAFLNE